MATYVIGDLQGCYTALRRLLDQINFKPDQDQLWFAGDLVSRGPESLQCLRFVKSLGKSAITILGNHDLSLIAAYYGVRKPHKSLKKLIKAPDYHELIFWLRYQPLLHVSEQHQAIMVHAGISPHWNLATAQANAQAVERRLHQFDPSLWFASMYGDTAQWHDDLTQIERERYTINAFTRMRFCHHDMSLNFDKKLAPEVTLATHSDLVPWFQHPQRKQLPYRLYFGHWSTLGYYHDEHVTALDTGCVWNGMLSAVCIESQQHFSIACHE